MKRKGLFMVKKTMPVNLPKKIAEIISAVQIRHETLTLRINFKDGGFRNFAIDRTYTIDDE